MTRIFVHMMKTTKSIYIEADFIKVIEPSTPAVAMDPEIYAGLHNGETYRFPKYIKTVAAAHEHIGAKMRKIF